MRYSRVIGIGSYLPEKVLANKVLENSVQTTDLWITSRTGIKERRIIGAEETLTDMAEVAAKKALLSAGISKENIGYLLLATSSSEYFLPGSATLLQQRLGLASCPALDVNAACAGFIYALDLADKYIKSGAADYILLVAADALSKITDWQDRGTCILFGDGAGAIVLKADNKPGVRSVHVHADGNYVDLLYASSGIYDQDSCIKMRGNEVFKFAVTKLSEVALEALTHNKMTIDDISWLVPHQANLRIIKATAKKLQLPLDKVVLTIKEHGNTSAASIPLAWDVALKDGRIKSGARLLLEAVGAGFTWGSALIDV